jgi:hypothetical protein
MISLLVNAVPIHSVAPSRVILQQSNQGDVPQFLREINKLTARAQTCNSQKGMFLVKGGNEWLNEAKRTPTPKMLFGKLWHQGELCILYADTNVGKSILAVQIGDSISKGIKINGFECEVEPQIVLYIDFEMSPKQFELRYSIAGEQHYRFDDNFKRAELNPDLELPEQYKTFDDYLPVALEKVIKETGAKVIIVDNITYLKSDTERAKDALPLMKVLKQLKQKYDLSMLVLAHTPKRNAYNPLSVNDLQGSKMLINFCDSAFAIGVNAINPKERYIKQMKARNSEKVYDMDNVCLCQVHKLHNFLKFEFTGYSHEQELLNPAGVNSSLDIQEILKLKKQGLSNVAVAGKFGVTEGAIRKHLKKIKDED